MSTSFLEALKKRSEQINSGITQTRPEIKVPESLKPIESEVTETPLIVTCDRVLNRKRLDLFFSRRPDQEVLNKLHGANWHFRPKDKAWYHFDSEENRQFCIDNFNADFDQLDRTQDSEAPEVPDTDEAPNNESKQVTLTSSRDEYSSEYDKYKQQVNELMAELKLDAADLQLMAIDMLHKKLFSQN